MNKENFITEIDILEESKDFFLTYSWSTPAKCAEQDMRFYLPYLIFIGYGAHLRKGEIL